MKRMLKVTVIMAMFIILAAAAYGETKVDLSGQVRVRSEVNRKSFDPDHTDPISMTYLRTRINVKAYVDDNAFAFIQFQDSRILGSTNSFGELQSGTLEDGESVDIHQAYLKYNLFTKDNWTIGIKAGRFEYNWANQRLFGAVGWHNVGRVWEGGLAWYDNERVNITAGSFIAIEDVPGDIGDTLDYSVNLLTVDIKKANLKFLFENERIGMGTDYLNFTNFTGFFQRTMDQIDLELTAAIQFGDIDRSSDFSGLMFAGEIGFSLEDERNTRLAFGLDYASGDDGSDIDKIKTFDNLYWTGHKFNGFMDYFLGGGPNGLVDIMFRAKTDITNGWTAKGDIHLFSAAQEYTSFFDGENTTNVGTEIDLSVSTVRVKGMNLQWGASFFFADKDYSGFDNQETGYWVYGQSTINF